MSTLENELSKRVSESDWELMAKKAGMTAEELRAKIIPALDAVANGKLAEVDDDVKISLSEVTATEDCQSQKFEVSLFKVVGISGELTVCGTDSTNWTAELKFCLIVAGASVWCTSYRFDPHHVGICFNPVVGVAKAKLCFEILIDNNKVCLKISGDACVWAFGWRCGNFDQTLFCIPV